VNTIFGQPQNTTREAMPSSLPIRDRLRKCGQVREKKHESNIGEYSCEALFWLFSCFETLIIRLMKWTDSKLCF
jgi:hypothetical protein